MPIAVIRNEIGMISTAIRAARTFPSRKNSAIATSTAPSNRLRCTVAMVALTSFERSRVGVTFTPTGSDFSMVSNFSPTALATVRLFSPINIKVVPTTTS